MKPSSPKLCTCQAQNCITLAHQFPFQNQHSQLCVGPHMRLTKLPSHIRIENGQLCPPPQKRTNLETKLPNVRHMSMSKVFYLDFPNFVSKLGVIKHVWPPHELECNNIAANMYGEKNTINRKKLPSCNSITCRSIL